MESARQIKPADWKKNLTPIEAAALLTMSGLGVKAIRRGNLPPFDLGMADLQVVASRTLLVRAAAAALHPHSPDEARLPDLESHFIPQIVRHQMGEVYVDDGTREMFFEEVLHGQHGGSGKGVWRFSHSFDARQELCAFTELPSGYFAVHRWSLDPSHIPLSEVVLIQDTDDLHLLHSWQTEAGVYTRSHVQEGVDQFRSEVKRDDLITRRNNDATPWCVQSPQAKQALNLNFYLGFNSAAEFRCTFNADRIPMSIVQNGRQERDTGFTPCLEE